MKYKLKKFLCVVGLFFAFRLRLYYVWSRFIRLFTHDSDVKLPELNSVDELQNLVSKMVWRADPWYYLWDAIETAETAYKRFLNGESIGDCDEFAVFISRSIDSMCARGKRPFDSSLVFTGVLSVPYIYRDSRVSGHNVCLFEYVNGENKRVFGYMSNWFGGMPIITDCTSVAEVAGNVARLAGADYVLGWSYVTPGVLKQICFGGGFDVV